MNTPRGWPEKHTDSSIDDIIFEKFQKKGTEIKIINAFHNQASLL